MKTKKKQTLFEWLTQTILILIREEETLALKYSFKTNYAKILALLSLFFITFMIVNYLIFNVISSYYNGADRAEKKYKNAVIVLVQKLDSLKLEVAQKDSFIINIQNIISGTKPATKP